MDTVRWRRALPALALVLALLATACASARSTVKTSPTVTASAARRTPTGAATPRPDMWTTVNNLPTGSSAPQFAPSDPHIAYVCVYKYPNGTLLDSTAQLYTSADGGRSWQPDSTAPALGPEVAPNTAAGCQTFVDATDARDVFLQISRSVMDPGSGGDFAHALYRSRDGGATWQQLTEPNRSVDFTVLVVVDSRLVATPYWSYPVGCGGTSLPSPSTNLRASDDGGLTWHEIGNTIASQGYWPVSLVVAGTTIFAAATLVPLHSNQLCGGGFPATPTPSGPLWTVWRSVDGGDTWSLVTLPAAPTEFSLPTFAAQAHSSGFYGILVITKCDDTCQHVTGITTLYSTDSGATWAALGPLSQSNIMPDMTYMVPKLVTPSGAVLVEQVTAGNALTPGPLYVWRPGATSLAYYADAPPNNGSWTIAVTPQGAFLWSFEWVLTSASRLEMLPLP